MFLREVRNTTLNAFENQDYPFDDLVSKVVSVRDMSRSPIFDVLFQLESGNNITEMDFPGITVKPYGDESLISTKYDLIMLVHDRGEQLDVEFEFNTSLFKRETINVFIGYFTRIISLIAVDPGIPLSRVEITPEEKTNSIRGGFTDDLEDEY
jgi:non-ribosomal peptide synthetase component F